MTPIHQMFRRMKNGQKDLTNGSSPMYAEKSQGSWKLTIEHALP